MGKRVLLVEDDPSLALSVVDGLSDEGFAVAHAADGDAAREALRAGGWDLVILDWWLPGADGLEVLEGHRREGGTTPVLFLTARDAVSDRVRGLDGGADDYLCKPFAFDELLARARALIRRGRPVEVMTLTYRDVRVDLASQRAGRAGRPLDLTAKELALLIFFLRHPDEVLSRTRIYGHVWGEDYDFVSNTLDVHIKGLRRALEARGPRVIQTVRGRGYLLADSPPAAVEEDLRLVTRVSVAFLVALALALGGFSVCLYYVAGLRLRLALDQELEAALDRFPDRAGQSGRVIWAVFDEEGRRVEGAPGGGRPVGLDSFGFGPGAVDVARMTVLDGSDLGPIAVDVATTIAGPDGLRWRVLARPIGGGHHHGGPHEAGGEDHHPGRGSRDEWETVAHGPGHRSHVLAAWASLEPVEAEVRSLAAVLPLIALGLWALAAAIGRHFARRALAPLLLLAESARAMPYDDGRLPSPGTRDELEDFARSFNGLLDRLHVALERQRQFTGQASHQLRTPLAALIAAIEVARRRPRSVEEHELVLDRLHHDSLRLWRVVEALLFLARADAEAELPDLERLDLGAWAADHLQAWSGHERATDLRFEGHDGGQCWARAHRPLLGQLVDNLLENACKYSEPGTPIVVRAWGEPAAVALTVEDQGCGIPSGELPRVFEPFYRAESARRLGREGVGLGLAVARRIAAAHGGTIAAESVTGQGCRLVVRLPRAAAMDDAPAVVEGPHVVAAIPA